MVGPTTTKAFLQAPRTREMGSTTIRSIHKIVERLKCWRRMRALDGKPEYVQPAVSNSEKTKDLPKAASLRR